MDMTRVIEKWFEKHNSLTIVNYEMLKEMATFFIDEPEPKTRQETASGIAPEIVKKYTKQNGKLAKGKSIGYIGNVSIYQNVLEEIQEEYTKQKPDPESVMNKYYTFTNPKSASKYLWGYRKQLGLVRPRGSKITFRDELGDNIYQFNHNKIYSNVLKDFKEALKAGRSLRKVIKHYFPNHKGSTIKTYTSMYKRYIKEIEKTEIDDLVRKGFRASHPPADHYAYNDVYQTFILQSEVEKVKDGLRKVGIGYKPTVKQVSEEQKLPRQRVRAVLNQLMFENRAGYHNPDGIPIYFLKE